MQRFPTFGCQRLIQVVGQLLVSEFPYQFSDIGTPKGNTELFTLSNPKLATRMFHPKNLSYEAKKVTASDLSGELAPRLVNC
uniref:Uncharacterized protein n=1 Tax=Curvibacter symbiont subsp. Hydra magnipapillata TaxID=667019 RepID=C9Y939_CURXX|nr:hypothetical protein Csp_A06400 [Curvibacter putative symbiont of Hydra magnipapillata]